MSGAAGDSASVMADVEAARLELCDWLETLDDSDWSVASLCEGWSVKDVVAHLCLGPRESRMTFVRGIVRYIGNFDRMTLEHARRHAAQSTSEELIAQLRSTAASTVTSPGGSPIDTLVDVIVHGQDIARPLGRTWEVPLDRVARVLDRVLASRWYAAKKRLAQIDLRATDIDWSVEHGGDEVSGPVIDLLLVAIGRPAGLDALAAAGIAPLGRRLAG